MGLFDNKEFQKHKDFGLGPLEPMKEGRILTVEKLLSTTEGYLNNFNQKVAAKIIRIAIEELEELESILDYHNNPDKQEAMQDLVRKYKKASGLNPDYDFTQDKELNNILASQPNKDNTTTPPKKDAEGKTYCHYIPSNLLIQLVKVPKMEKGRALLMVNPEDYNSIPEFILKQEDEKP